MADMKSAAQSPLTLKRALLIVFGTVVALFLILAAVLYRLDRAEQLAAIRAEEIERSRSLAEGLRGVIEPELARGQLDSRLQEVIRHDFRTALYIRVEHINGAVIMEHGGAAVPPRPATLSGVTMIATGTAPAVHDITITLGPADSPLGLFRIGLAEQDLEARSLASSSRLKRQAFLLAAGLLPIGLLAFLFLVWTHRRLRLAESRLQEQERLGYVGAVASGVVHDVRHPLGSLRLGIDLALEDLKNGRADAATGRLALLTDEFDRIQFALDAFRDYAHRGSFAPVRLDLREPVTEVIHLVRGTLAAARVDLDLQSPSDPLFALVDAPRLKQALLNLILNAAEAMPNGGKLSIALAPAGNKVEIAVKDTGRGIPADILGQIFEPYYTTKESGLGLGLSIVKQAIEEHRGSLAVDSDESGTVFRIRLPRAS